MIHARALQRAVLLGVLSGSNGFFHASRASAQEAPPPPPLAPGAAAPACPSNLVAADGTCLVSPEAPSTPPPVTPPAAPPPVVVAPALTPAPAKAGDSSAGAGPNHGLLFGGLALFATGYVATIGVNYGVCAGNTTWRGCDSKELSFIPIVGPFVLAGTENTEPSYRVLAVTLGLMQAGGVALFGLSYAGGKGEPAKTAYFMPRVSRDGGGASVFGRF
jgi:hypothetical protein